MLCETVPDSWRAALAPALASPEAHALGQWLRVQEAEGAQIFPPRGQRLRALELTPLESVKVVILGQDPYHGPGQAHGLAFSVPEGVRIPPSLHNIYRELADDLGKPIRSHGSLEDWAQQGVLLLNTTLTVEAGRAGSHAKRGWDAITDAVVAAVAAQRAPSVFILWGSHAQGKVSSIAAFGTDTRHLVLRNVHPSPLSAYRGFFGSKPFSTANAFLEQCGRGPIDW